MRFGITCRYCPFQEVELNPTLCPSAPGWGRLSDLFPKTRAGEGKDTRLHGETWQDTTQQWHRWASPVRPCACHPPHRRHRKSASPVEFSSNSYIPSLIMRQTPDKPRLGGHPAGGMAITPQDPWSWNTETLRDQMRWRRHRGLNATGTERRH